MRASDRGSSLPSHTGVSSENAAFDRRLDWARSYLDAGDAGAGEGMLEDLVGEAPGFSAAWFVLGESRERTGAHDGAILAYRQVVILDPSDPLGAGACLARLGAQAVSGALSPAFVRALFDQYAPRFDASLRGRLAYRGPEVLAAAVSQVRESEGITAGGSRAFDRVLDLGCGTGLCAPLFAPLAREMVGVDLAPRMIAEAERLGLYSALHAGDMHAFLADEADASADLILMADAACYLGELGPVLAQVGRVLRPAGHFAFTAETHAGPGMILTPGLRYAHSAALLAALVAASGLSLCHLAPAWARQEHGIPVPGLVAVARGVSATAP